MILVLIIILWIEFQYIIGMATNLSDSIKFVFRFTYPFFIRLILFGYMSFSHVGIFNDKKSR